MESGPIVSSLIAAVATVAVAVIGLRTKRPQVDEATRAAHAAMWRQLEETHAWFREAERASDLEDALDAQVKKVNLVFMENSLYLPESLHALINRYIRAFERLARAMEGADDAVKRDFQATASFAPSGLDDDLADTERDPAERSAPARELSAAKKEVHALRSQVKALLQRGAGMKAGN